MPRVDQDLELYTNADEIFTIAIKDESDNPVNIVTGLDSYCWVLSRGGTEIVRYDDSDPELVPADVDATNDGMRCNLTSTVTGALELGRLYIHQAWGVTAGRERPLCVGYVTVLRGDGC